MTESAEVMVCKLGDYGSVDREMAAVLYDDKKIAECYTDEDAEFVGAALRAYGRLCRAVREDTARMDWLESMALEAFVSMCFELDGGVHLTIERPSSEAEAHRNKNTVRDAIDSARHLSPQAGGSDGT